MESVRRRDDWLVAFGGGTMQLVTHPLILSLPQSHRGSSFLHVVSRNEGQY